MVFLPLFCCYVASEWFDPVLWRDQPRGLDAVACRIEIDGCACVHVVLYRVFRVGAVFPFSRPGQGPLTMAGRAMEGGT